MGQIDRRREYATALHRLRHDLGTVKASISARDCGIHVGGLDVKESFLQQFDAHLQQLDWLSAQIMEDLGPLQDVTEEVRTLGDVDERAKSQSSPLGASKKA